MGNQILVGRETVEQNSTRDLLHDFRIVLTETIHWCSQRALVDEPKESLRSLRHPVLLRTRDDQIRDVIDSRSRQIYYSLNNLRPKLVDDLQSGRLMALDPDITMSDGVAEIETDGFLDIDNIPPCDTWVTFVTDHSISKLAGKSTWAANYLVAWIPPQFISIVDHGIRVNPEESIVWLDDVTSSFTDLLRKHKLLNAHPAKS